MGGATRTVPVGCQSGAKAPTDGGGWGAEVLLKRCSLPFGLRDGLSRRRPVSFSGELRRRRRVGQGEVQRATE